MSAVLSEAAVSAGGITIKVQVRAADEVSVGLALLGKILDQAMLVAAERVLVPELKRTLSVQGPPASAPFTPPHKAAPPDGSSQAKPSPLPPLIDSVGAWAFPDGGIAVGTVNKYGLYLEIGTQDMAPRPWLVPTLTRTDVMNAFNAAVRVELERLLAAAAGDGAPAQGSPQGSVTA